MKKVFSILFMILFTSQMFAFEKSIKIDDKKSEAKIEVYYFHLTRRCATCQAVERESEKALEILYPEMIKNGKILFLSVDIEDETNKALADSLEISGQTLLFVMGDKKVNLTNAGFMYAKTKPEKLQAKFKETIDSFLEK